jgi:chromate transporter
VRDASFRWLYLASVLCSVALFVPFVHLPAYAEERGVDPVAAAGLIGAIVIKMAQPLLREGAPALAVTAAGFVAVGVMRWPLPYVLLVLVPLSIALSWWVRR